MEKKFKLLDTTLRDGEQTAEVVFANEEKVFIAKMLDEIGVDQIEAGIPVMGEEEKSVIKKIVKSNLKASIMGWNRAVIKDIEASIDCGVDAVAISISTSDIHIKHKLHSTRSKVLEQMVKAAEFAKANGLYVSVNAEDASRTDEVFLTSFFKAAKEAGADRVRFCDTVGILNPISTYNIIKNLKETVDIDIEMHTHNDLGMATANAIAGAMAGASYLGVTVNGLGERAGNASLEEVMLALKHGINGDVANYNMGKLKDLCTYVAKASNREIPAWKAVVGEKIFYHESGIHADGALKNPLTYEIICPDELGLERKIVIGKHSGTAAIKHKLSAENIHIDDFTAYCLLEKVRNTATAFKRPLTDQELFSLYEETVREDKLAQEA
ncbi:homocitrate synthase [Clostridium formicaceticum]|uniref:2-isopropylmalate synthase n=1 Tax=Clostridium formicaceticum TaxID=1497 RepID=A0AAC9RJ53_9CLOT|nr:homocitrate synthase [Clostridium formicaceticum]AOY75909.1 homocitrate synthase [Clostridium formicaceticum]ARE86253.1 2-isopropylmalate synthase [Clostridium formicaceticum]